MIVRHRCPPLVVLAWFALGCTDPSTAGDEARGSDVILYLRPGTSDDPYDRVVAIAPDGTGERVLDCPLGVWRELAVSPDGRHIALLDGTLDGEGRLLLLNATCELKRSLYPRAANVSWSTNATLVFRAVGLPDSTLRTVDTSGVVVKSGVTETRTADVTLPSASPDGHSLAFSRRRQSAASGPDIWTIALNGNSLRQVTTATGGASHLQPSWSHDGRWIAYISSAQGSRVLHRVRTDGREDQVVTTRAATQPVGVQSRASWSPDGRRMVFVRSGSSSNLFTVDVETGEERQLTFGEAIEWQPQWVRLATP